ncbi:MAG: 4-alpha-glucanotransferase [Dehalococcoidia bacterium]|nr:4-alpha-glucanotransferase [Dehalococcoidia bacterium]
MRGNLEFPRASGILLHLTSLPGPCGIGDLGSGAYRFADFLASSRQSLWQMLPLGPTGYGNSPYQCLSAFAGNPQFLSLDKLAADGLLEGPDLEHLPSLPSTEVSWEAAARFKTPLLRKSFENFEKHASPAMRREFDAFCAREKTWLEDYALFLALREAHGLAHWNTWEEDIRDRRRKALREWSQRLAGEIRYHQYLQFQFFRQLDELRWYCHERQIRLIGDAPIFVAPDSADVWANPEMFYLDVEGRPTVVAGVPPDYFSMTGQLWGNPLYRWDVMEHDGYEWWIQRLQAAYRMVDIIRLDHFRGFEGYWEIPASERTAVNGRWVPGPGARFFEAVQKELGRLPIIAEDLGVITPEVEAMRDRFGFPGMKVLQFAFGGDPTDETALPHNYPENCVVYTGTHDNDTTVGWFRSAGTGDTTRMKEAAEREINFALTYLGTDGKDINWDFIHLAMSSRAHTVIIPLQDVLGLGGEARLNLPGRAGGNWGWRFTLDMLTELMGDRLRVQTVTHGRSLARK